MYPTDGLSCGIGRPRQPGKTGTFRVMDDLAKACDKADDERAKLRRRFARSE